MNEPAQTECDNRKTPTIGTMLVYKTFEAKLRTRELVDVRYPAVVVAIRPDGTIDLGVFDDRYVCYKFVARATPTRAGWEWPGEETA